jgi:CRP-like cAMP-binding protein
MASFRRSQNDFLAELPEATFELLRPHMRTMPLVGGTVLVQSGASPTHVYFPHAGIISKVIGLAGGEAIEVAMIGRDGLFGEATALFGGASPTSAVVRFPGVATVVDIGHFRSVYDNSAALRFAAAEWLWNGVTIAERIAACNAAHSIEARLCRRLLMMCDLAGSDELPVTQETLAQMLGVRRNSVSLVAIALQQAGLVKYSRGRLIIRNAEGLSRLACECYRNDLGFRRGAPAREGDAVAAHPC